MREVLKSQMRFGEVEIGDIKFDLRSRDEIPKLLIGLQALYCDSDVRRKVFERLAKLVPVNINPNNGQIIGHILQQKELKQVQRLEKMQKKRLQAAA